MKKLLKSILIMTSLFMLSGCEQMNSDFDCPIKTCIRCQSLDEVNAAIDRGEIVGMNDSEIHEHSAYMNASTYGFKECTLAKNSPIRYPEDVMKVWIAPFEDTSGNYHQASNVYTIVKPGHWGGYPIKEIEGEDDV